MKTKICIFGDSVGKGVMYDSEKKRYVASAHPFIELLRERLGIDVDNFCRFGCTVTKGAELINKRMDKLCEYDYVILQYGGNDSDFDWGAVAASPETFHDCKTPVDSFCDTYSQLISDISAQGVEPVLMNLAPVDSDRYFRWISATNNGDAIMRFLGEARRIEHWNEVFNNAVWALAARTGTPVLDIRSPLLFERNFSDYICADGIHPNEIGHKLIADRLIKTSKWAFSLRT